MGRTNATLWFDRFAGNYLPRFSVRQTLKYDPDSNRYKLYALVGNATEYCAVSGALCRQVDPAGIVGARF